MNQSESKRDIFQGRGIPVPGEDIDTDRIIPARYLKCITFDELGQYAFFDERFDADGQEKPHPFNESKYAGGKILIVNSNFGCGSSREHAPQALMRMGIQIIVGQSFAEIFAGNCTALGIPTVQLDAKAIEFLMMSVEKDPHSSLTISLEDRSITIGDKSFSLSMPEAYRQSLVSGTWDTASVLMANLDQIHKTAARLPYV